MHAAGPGGAILQFQFYYKSGYGLEVWNRNKWQVVKEWSADNWVEYALPAAGNYYVVGHVVAEGETWRKGDPQGGFTVVVREKP